MSSSPFIAVLSLTKTRLTGKIPGQVPQIDTRVKGL